MSASRESARAPDLRDVSRRYQRITGLPVPTAMDGFVDVSRDDLGSAVPAKLERPEPMRLIFNPVLPTTWVQVLSKHLFARLGQPWTSLASHHRDMSIRPTGAGRPIIQGHVTPIYEAIRDPCYMPSRLNCLPSVPSRLPGAWLTVDRWSAHREVRQNPRIFWVEQLVTIRGAHDGGITSVWPGSPTW